MAQGSAALLPMLQEMFPTLGDDILLGTLEVYKNDVESTVAALLEMCAEAGGAHDAADAGAALHVAPPVTSKRGPKGSAFTEPTTAPPKGLLSATKDSPRSQSTGPPAQRDPPSLATSAPKAPAHCHGPKGRDANGAFGTRGLRTWGQLRELSPLAALSPGLPQPQNGLKYIPPDGASRTQLTAAEFPGLATNSTSPADAGPAPRQRDASGRPAPPVAGQTTVEGAPPPRRRASSRDSPSAGAKSTGPVHVGGLAAACPGGALVKPHAKGPPVASTAGGYARAAASAAARGMRAVSSWPHLAAAAADGRADQMYGNAGARGGGGGAEAAAEADAPSSAWQSAALEELCLSHAWAGRELLEAVCLTLKYDLTEVVSALDELRAASYQDTEQEGGGASASASTCVSSSDEDDEEDEDYEAGDDAGARALGLDDDFVAGAGAPRGAVRGAAAAAVSHKGRGRHGDSGGGAGGDGASGGDAYVRHRREALKLTHAWRKKMGRASAAFSCGDRALGRALVAEAQELRVRAAVAHAEAACRIEAEMNDGRQLSQWELDLHGLHADEAVQALGRRIAALEAANDAARKDDSSDGNGGRGGGGSGGPVPGVCGGRGAGPHHLASRRVLRVIVGRGLHSSGGEASLPRVVGAFLLGAGYRFTPRAGTIEVQLRRYQRSAAAAAPPRP